MREFGAGCIRGRSQALLVSGCAVAGELRPMFVHGPDLSATLRLWDRHTEIVSNARDPAEIDVARPTATRGGSARPSRADIA